MRIKKISYWFALLAPLVAWVAVFYSFLSADPVMGGETFASYAKYKFYFANILQGVYPQWNPYTFWGIPSAVDIRQVGDLNPVFFLMPLLYKLGGPFYRAFLIVVVLYHWLGMGGFYLLARRVIKDKTAAYWAYVVMLFSSFSLLIFSHFILLLIFVPAVWFFYFLTDWARSWRRSSLAGLIFTLMIMMTTYLPFYFFTVLGVAGVAWMVIYWPSVRTTLRQAGQFARNNGLLILTGLTLIGLSSVPVVKTYLMTKRHEVVAPSRHGGENSLYEKGVLMSYDKSTDGALSARMSWGDLFAHLDHVRFANDGFFYLSLMTFVILCLGIITRVNRALVFWTAVTMVIFLLSITNASPLHPLLFRHIFFFQMFRNLHYLLPFLLGSFILLCAQQLSLLTGQDGLARLSRRQMTGYLTAIHLGCLVFLLFQEKVIWSSYLTVGLSWLFWVTTTRRAGFSARPIFWVSLTVLSLIQPVEVFVKHGQYARQFKSNTVREGLLAPVAKPAFSFLRPLYNDSHPPREPHVDPHFYEQFPWLALKDSAGFTIPYSYGFPTQWSFYLFRQVPTHMLRAYTRFKFLLYDYIEVVTDNDLKPADRHETLYRQKNRVYVSIPSSLDLSSGPVHSKGYAPQARIVVSNSKDFDVVGFDVNTVRLVTNLTEPKFLVYNDSFTPDWQAFVNGQRVALYRANFAFKGIFVPAGKAQIVLAYRPAVPTGFYFALMPVFALMLGGLVWTATGNFHRKKHKQAVSP